VAQDRDRLAEALDRHAEGTAGTTGGGQRVEGGLIAGFVIAGPHPAASDATRRAAKDGRALKSEETRNLPSCMVNAHANKPMKQPAVYILTNQPGGVLYIGVTSDLIKRVWQHRSDAVEGFSRRYRLHELVYFEQFGSMVEAIEREKELKKWRRAWKVALIEKGNAAWRDLWPDLME
jgi:putative endonuclease